MKRDDIYQLIGIAITLIVFIWETRKTSGSNKILLWVFFGIIVILFFVLNFYSYTKQKLNQIELNKQEILKLKDQISFRKSLEQIHHKLGQLEERCHKK